MWPCLRKCVPWGGLQSFKCPNQVQEHFLFLLPTSCFQSEVELSATSPAPWLPVWCFVSYSDDNGLNLWTVSQPQFSFIKFSFIKVAVVMVSLHSKKIPTRTFPYFAFIPPSLAKITAFFSYPSNHLSLSSSISIHYWWSFLLSWFLQLPLVIHSH